MAGPEQRITCISHVIILNELFDRLNLYMRIVHDALSACARPALPAATREPARTAAGDLRFRGSIS
ncbi:hypothetical protein ACVMIH_005351 [Bradyrhizobium sp. USDA 4503]